MSYFDKRQISASMIKKVIKYENELTIDVLEEWHNEEYSSEALRQGTIIHEYLLEGIGFADNMDLLKPYAEIKPIIDLYGGEREKEINKTMFGVPCKSKIDLLTDKMVFDLKTTSNIDDVKGAIEMFGYDISMHFYSLMTGVDLKVLFFVSKHKKNLKYFYYPIKTDWRINQLIEDMLILHKDLFIKWSKLK